MSVDAVTVVESSPVVEEEQAYTTYASTDNYSYVEANTPVTTSYTPTSQVNTTLSNGNTVGQIGLKPQLRWSLEEPEFHNLRGNILLHVNPTVTQMFQMLLVHQGYSKQCQDGAPATVQDQVNSAINAYKAQGLSAWG